MLEQITCRVSHNDCCPSEHLNKVHSSALLKLMQALLREEMLVATYEDNKLIFSLPRTTGILFIDAIQLGSLARYRSCGNIYVQANNGSIRQITNPSELLDVCIAELKSEYDKLTWENLSKEIDDHLRNALLISYKSCHLAKKIAQEAKAKNCNNFIQWLKDFSNITDEIIFFEQWASRGHPHHPCSKTKLGFSLEDVVNYSPEFHPEVPIIMAAIHRNIMHVEAMDPALNYVDWFANNFPSIWQHWTNALKAKGLSVDAYLPVPIHPWQAENKITDLFKDFFAKGLIYLFKDIKINASPTLSFRTLAPPGPNHIPYIKLPVAVQATSVFRTLSPKSTENTPKISRLLNQILVKENNFNNRLNILCEIYGLHLNQIPDEQGKHLTAIFRENPKVYLGEKEIGIVVAALFEKSPITNTSLLIELMHLSGVVYLKDAIQYFHHYVDLVLGSYLDLYLLYGISLEGHQQNTLAVFRNGSIMRFIARDFDGTDIHVDTLNALKIAVDDCPGSPNVWQDRKHVRNSLLHAVYQSHLGELVLLLANHFKCEEEFFWQVIKNVTQERFIYLKDRINQQIWQTEYRAILEADWSCKAFLRMRLQKKYSPEGLFFKIANPLSGVVCR